MRVGVILYGPPASGKDTVTDALLALDTRFTAFKRLKIGSGKASGYRPATVDDLAQLEERGDVLYRNHRYGNTYVVDRPTLQGMLDAGRVPVLHLGQVQGITAVEVLPSRWVRVLLWCSRTATLARAEVRGDSDVDRRLSAWDETRLDLHAHTTFPFDVIVDTEQTSAEQAARAVHLAVIDEVTSRRAATELFEVTT